jgi:hypothetical protein
MAACMHSMRSQFIPGGTKGFGFCPRAIACAVRDTLSISSLPWSARFAKRFRSAISRGLHVS